jgi:hypothetical protein
LKSGVVSVSIGKTVIFLELEMEMKRGSDDRKETKDTSAKAVAMAKEMTRDMISNDMKTTAMKHQRILPDDIDCVEWLHEVGMDQYRETFQSNFTHGGKYLSRKRLSQVRLQDFPKMNITNFSHQKILFEHIKLTLQHEYTNPERRRMSQILSPAKVSAAPRVSGTGAEEKGSLHKAANDFKNQFERKQENGGEESGEGENLAESRRNSKNLKKQDSTASSTESIDQKKKAQRAVIRKRNSFDGKAWESIHKYRGTPKEDTPNAGAAPVEPKPRRPPRRRSTFDGLPSGQDDAASKGKMYGNMVRDLLLLLSSSTSCSLTHLSFDRLSSSIYCKRKCFKFKSSIFRIFVTPLAVIS